MSGSAVLMFVRDNEGNERVVVEEAPVTTLITDEFLATWRAEEGRHLTLVDQDTFRFGTAGEGCGVVTYRVAADQSEARPKTLVLERIDEEGESRG